MARDSRAIRSWAEKHGHNAFAAAKIEADSELVDTLAALAVRITRATGFYRGSHRATVPVITFGAVTLTTPDGDTSTFEIQVK